MDTKDVSEVNEFQAMLKSIQARAEEGARRKGQLVTDHPPSAELVSRQMTRLLALKLRVKGEDRNQIHTSQVPPPYPPCALPVAALQPIAITDMRLETHHRGRMVQLFVLTPATRMTGILAIVEDQHGTAVLLQLYHQPEENLVPAEETLRHLRVCIVKEPFFKCSVDGSYSIRVDHVSDIVWLPDADERILPRWEKQVQRQLSTNSVVVRKEGNMFVQDQKWANAERSYSIAIDLAANPEEKELAYLNRSLTNLKLGRLETALSDAIKGTNSHTPSDKGLFRQARALYALQAFETCLNTLALLKKLYPDNKAAGPEIQRAKARVNEQLTGTYNFSQMYRQARSTPPLIDCATYSSPVEVQTSPGKGNGLFTTRPVCAGELVLCEKAFAYQYAGDDDPRGQKTILMNMSTKKITMGGGAGLLTQTVQKTYNNPQMRSLIHDLHRGDYAVLLENDGDADGTPIIDTFLIEKVISLNSFGTPRTSSESFAETLHERSTGLGARSAQRPAFGTCGIWLKASRINHSCVGNVRRSFIGDMHIVRATKDLEKGVEVNFAYSSPFGEDSYEDMKKKLKNWGFVCDCGLCTAKKTTTATQLQYRKKLLKKFKAGFIKGTFNNFTQAKRLLKDIETTYTMASSEAPRIELADPYLGLGANMISEGKVFDGIEVIVSGLEALGYQITAYPPIGDTNSQVRFRVTRWGWMSELTLQAFLHLYGGYKETAPELCRSLKGYIETIYMIVVGEEETLLERFSYLT